MLLTVPHVALLVDEVTCTFRLLPGRRLVALPPQVSVPFAIAQSHPDEEVPSVQDIPLPAGSASVIVTCVAVDRESLVTLISYPIRSPALTGDWSATFVIAISVQGEAAQVLVTVDDVRRAFTLP